MPTIHGRYVAPEALAARKRQHLEAVRTRKAAGLSTAAMAKSGKRARAGDADGSRVAPSPTLDRNAIKAELLAELDLPARDQAVADAVVKHYEREVLPKRDLEVAQAVDDDNRQRAAAKAALAADVPTEVRVVHRDPQTNLITHVTTHAVSTTDELEDLVDA